MKSEKPSAPRKTYDAIEDAISQSKNPDRTSDDQAEKPVKKTIDKGEKDASRNDDKVAARVYRQDAKERGGDFAASCMKRFSWLSS
jgi:hypothetical protein